MQKFMGVSILKKNSDFSISKFICLFLFFQDSMLQSILVLLIPSFSQGKNEQNELKKNVSSKSLLKKRKISFLSSFKATF